MKTLYCGDGGYIQLDEDRNISPCQFDDYCRLRRVMLATEPTKVVYTIGTKTYEVYADKNDIVVMFSNTRFENPIAVIKSKEWASNLIKYRTEEQEAKEQWALAQKTKEYEKDREEDNKEV